MTSPKLRTSLAARKSYLSAGKSLAISSTRRLTPRKLLLMPCAGVGSGRGCCATTAIASANKRPRIVHILIWPPRVTSYRVHVHLFRPLVRIPHAVMIYEAAIDKDFPVAENDDAARLRRRDPAALADA